MATSILMASDHTTSLSLAEDLQTTRNDDHPHHQAAARKSSSARRKTSRANENNKKKQPQRGKGVAELERLRSLQERWNKMTEINTASGQPLPCTTLDTSSFAEPKAMNSVPLNFSKFGGFGTAVNGVDLNLMQQGFIVQRAGNGGSGLFHDQGLAPDDKFQGYLYGIGNVNGNSKELPSTPKVVKCYADHHCADCHKKKRIVTGENLAFNGVKNLYAHLPSVAGCDFIGLKVGSSQNIKGGNGDHEQKATFHAGTSAFSICNTEQGVEVVALHKKGSSGLMEYEFFPGKGGCRSYESSRDELLMMKKLMRNSEFPAVMGGEASCVPATTSNTTTAGGSVDASTSIDLSLRLSY